MKQQYGKFFFHTFCAWFREDIYQKFVKKSRGPEELEKVMGPYAALGLMGAIGSTDAVHIHRGCCPSTLRTLHTGKEGFPTLVYNVTGAIQDDSWKLTVINLCYSTLHYHIILFLIFYS